MNAMRIFFLLCIAALMMNGCSKKSDEKPASDQTRTVDLKESDDSSASAKKSPSDRSAVSRPKVRPDKQNNANNDDKPANDPDLREMADKNDEAMKNADRGKPAAEIDADDAAKLDDPKNDDLKNAADNDMDAKNTAAEENLEFNFDNDAAVDAKKSPRKPRVRKNMDIESLITLRELREKTGYSGTFADSWLVGYSNPDDKTYQSMRLETANSSELGFAVQIWRPGNEQGASRRFDDLYKQSFGGHKISDVATDAFSANHHKLNELGFLEKNKKAAVLISCTESICSPAQLKAIAQSIQRRL